MTQIVEHLPSECKTLGSNPSMHKKKIHWLGVIKAATQYSFKLVN
jgi:hypothetical protein